MPSDIRSFLRVSIPALTCILLWVCVILFIAFVPLLSNAESFGPERVAPPLCSSVSGGCIYFEDYDEYDGPAMTMEKSRQALEEKLRLLCPAGTDFIELFMALQFRSDTYNSSCECYDLYHEVRNPFHVYRCIHGHWAFFGHFKSPFENVW